MLTFVITSLQTMLKPSLESDDFDVLSGQLVLLAKKYEEKSNCEQPILQQNQTLRGLPDPFKTNITGTLLNVVTFGEVVAGRIDCPFPVLIIIKLPCGTKTPPTLKDKIISAIGELQLHIIQVIPEIETPEIIIQKPKKVFNTHMGDLVFYTKEDIAIRNI